MIAAAFCDGCGRPGAEGDHARCRARRAATDPPRFCTQCARKLVVQVLPTGYTARCVRCGELPRSTGVGPDRDAAPGAGALP